MGDLARADSGSAVDLLLSYRAVGDWNRMAALVNKMAVPLAASLLVQEQVAFAYNRMGRRLDAVAILERLIEDYGPNPESSGLLGRVYKDAWHDAVSRGDAAAADTYIRSAIEAYLEGFEADCRDPYPGVNAVTLMEIADPPDPRMPGLLPIVRYAVQNKMKRTVPDYWDYATLMELAVLARDESAGDEALSRALTLVREPWEPETTARNLHVIRQARLRRSQPASWIEDLLRRLAHYNG
jgi:hypothetical protein